MTDKKNAPVRDLPSKKIPAEQGRSDQGWSQDPRLN